MFRMIFPRPDRSRQEAIINRIKDNKRSQRIKEELASKKISASYNKAQGE
jgi:hypothetical protein